MSKKKKNILKAIIVFMMAGAIALSALAPLFASEDNGNEDRMSNVRKTISEIRGERMINREKGDDVSPCQCNEQQEKLEEIKEEEIKEEEIKERRDVLRERILEIQSNLDKIIDNFHSTPDTRERKVLVRGVPSSFSFQYDLRERARGNAVRYLQIVLNVDPITRVANSGIGSPLKETDLFGENTRKALIRFQRKHGIPATGFFGSQTRAKAEEILKNGITVKEPVEKDIAAMRAGLLSAMETIKEARKEMELIKEEEMLLEQQSIPFDYKEEIKNAQNYATEQMICTMEVREMKRDGFSYTAKNGCEIGFLNQKGWE